MKHLLSSLILFAFAAFSTAQNSVYQQYVARYHTMAVDQMKRYGVPASITLAQGLLESNAGRSMLAVKANNHFGIKVGGDWTGPYVVKSDDRPDDRFRKYRSVEESYEDHSLFLRRPRYAALYDLEPTDYVGWARGLKAAGYATNPSYAQLLINIIEQHNLMQYDRLQGAHGGYGMPDEDILNRVRLCNDVVYVVVRQGETFSDIAKAANIRESRLRSYNEVDRHYRLKAGDRVFLNRKKSHVEHSLRGTTHRIMAGQSMYDIAQMYGVKVEKLYKWNRLNDDYYPTEDDVLILK